MQTITYILPELFIFLSVMFLLMVGVFLKKSFKLVNYLTIFILIFSIILVVNQPYETVKVFNNSFIILKTFWSKRAIN